MRSSSTPRHVHMLCERSASGGNLSLSARPRLDLFHVLGSINLGSTFQMVVWWFIDRYSGSSKCMHAWFNSPGGAVEVDTFINGASIRRDEPLCGAVQEPTFIHVSLWATGSRSSDAIVSLWHIIVSSWHASLWLDSVVADFKLSIQRSRYHKLYATHSGAKAQTLHIALALCSWDDPISGWNAWVLTDELQL